MLSVHLRLGLQCVLLPSGFLTKTPYALVFSPIRATRPARHISFVFITQSYFVKGTNHTHFTWRRLAPGPVWIVTENSPTTGLYSRTVNPAASSSTDWAVPAILKGKVSNVQLPYLWLHEDCCMVSTTRVTTRLLLYPLIFIHVFQNLQKDSFNFHQSVSVSSTVKPHVSFLPVPIEEECLLTSLKERILHVHTRTDCTDTLIKAVKRALTRF